MAERTEKDYYDKGRADASKDRYDPPHPILDTWLNDDSFVEDNRDYDKGWSSSHQGSSNCFISAACAEYAHLPDDADELVTIRRFRDDVIARTADGHNAIEEYYRVAPAIVQRIWNSADRDVIFQQLLARIRDAVDLIKTGRLCEAWAIYETELKWLRTKFGV